MEKERNYDNDGLDPSEEYLRKKKKGNDAVSYTHLTLPTTPYV